jgi:2,3-bisphosphoglycerate-independent phosphoglycerate mutase
MSTREELFKNLSTKNEKKIVLLVLDGLGDLEFNGKTPLESARKDNINKLTPRSILGLSIPIFEGITPGSGPSHLSLFGYDPIKYQIGRGVLEALGVDLKLEKNQVAIRGNFATLKNGIVTDRRAGRIPTDENRRLCEKLSNNIKKIRDIKIDIYPVKEHRIVIILSGQDLGDNLTDADPQNQGLEYVFAKAKDDKSKLTEEIVKIFTVMVQEILSDEPKANTILLRGFSHLPDIPSMNELFKLTPGAIANYPMYRGLAKLVGMQVINTGDTIESEFETLKENYEKYDFFYLHIKKTDSYGEDGNFEKKLKIIEEVDKYFPVIIDLNPDVLIITSDHSTPCVLKSHSWHPNPILFYSKYIIPDKFDDFNEKNCTKGSIGKINSMDILPLALANALKLKKFGA